MPARIAIVPATAAPAPTHVVVTIPREILKSVLAGSVASSGPSSHATSNAGGAAMSRPSSPLRHVVAAIALVTALLTVPLVRARRWRFVAGVAAIGVLATGLLARANIQAPAPPPRPAGPQTVEIVLIDGGGPVQVELRHGRQP